MTRLRAGRLGFHSWQGHWREFFSSSPRPHLFWNSPIFVSNV